MTQDAFAELDSEGNILDWNAPSEQMFDWLRQEALGQSFLLHAVSPSSRAALEHQFSLCLATDAESSGRQMETVALHHDGHEFLVEMRMARISHGMDDGLAIFMRDLTWLWRVRQDVHDAKQRYSAILDHLGDGYIENDLRGAYRFVNESFWRLFHVPEEERTADSPKQSRCPEELLGRSFEEYETGESTQRSRELYLKVFETGEPASAERDLSRGSRTIFVTSHIGLIRNRHGKPKGWRTLFRDCTERKLREKELAEAKAAAEAASRAKSEFLANMSHEIRTPMNGILGMAGMVLSTPLTAGQEDYVSTIKSSADHLLAILNDILDYSKIEAGKMVLDPSHINLRALIERAMESLAPVARQKGIRLALQIEPGVPAHVTGDSTRLRQILLNLLSNALKFTHRGEIRVEVGFAGELDSVPVSSPSEFKLHFAVRDTGIGISADQQQRIFHPFAQADASNSRQYGGTGLGLAISSCLVQLMKGRIWVESTLGEGAAFHFTAELQTAPQNSIAIEPGCEGSAGDHGATRRLRILVAEDNAVNQKLAQSLLRRMGHEVVIVENGVQAVKVVEEQPFDVVLMDLQMPIMDGYQATAAIREKEKSAGGRLPIIALTAESSVDVLSYRRAGLDGFVTKPIDTNDLARALQRAQAEKIPSTI